MPVQADNHKQGTCRVENYLHAIGIGKKPMALFYVPFLKEYGNKTGKSKNEDGVSE